jgi:hypothetical protein
MIEFFICGDPHLNSNYILDYLDSYYRFFIETQLIDHQTILAFQRSFSNPM